MNAKRDSLIVFMVWAALAVGPCVSWELAAAEQRFPDVVGVQVQPAGADRFNFQVTVSSPYDTPQRYADAFRVADQDGTVFGERKLLHDHAGEQPFTRSLYGVIIPRQIRTVIVQARDRKYGYGGTSVAVTLPGR